MSKMLQILRATGETELMALYPVKDVAAWLGNSVPVALKHYAMTIDDSVVRAVRKGAGIESKFVPPQLPILTHQEGKLIEADNEEAQVIMVPPVVPSLQNQAKSRPISEGRKH